MQQLASLLACVGLFNYMYISVAQDKLTRDQECTYTIKIPASQIEASCGGPRLIADVDELRTSNNQLLSTVAELQEQILFLTKEYETFAGTVESIKQETASWREVVAWPSHDPVILPKNNSDTNEGSYTDCYDAMKKSGSGKEGIYTINPGVGGRSFLTYCDDQGWLIALRRFSEAVDFDRNWSDFSGGFGNLSGEYWLGLENLHVLTSGNKSYQLRMDGLGHNNKLYHAEYDNMSVEGEMEDYILRIDSMTAGNIYPDQMFLLSGIGFSTKDRDNDHWNTGNCAQYYGGGWWMKNCGFSPTRRICNGSMCMAWGEVLLKKMTLKIRPMTAKGLQLQKDAEVIHTKKKGKKTRSAKRVSDE